MSVLVVSLKRAPAQESIETGKLRDWARCFTPHTPICCDPI